MTATKTKVTKTKAAPKPKKSDYASPAALARYDFETQKRAAELEVAVSASKGHYAALKERAGDAKKTYEADQIALNNYIRDRKENRGKPPKPNLFQKQDDKAKDAEMKKANDAAASPGSITIAEWIPEDLWRTFPINRLTEFGLTKSDAEKIESGEVKKGQGIGPIRTLGDLSKFTESHNGYSRTWADLKGIGQGGADRISDAHEKFWEAWRGGLAEKFAAESGITKPEPPQADVPQPSVNGDGHHPEDSK